ncbi:zf-CCHC domain-containing protein [Tanacetum coccineum]
MLNNKRSPSCKIGLGFDSSKASTRRTKIISFVESSAEKLTDGFTLPRSVSHSNGEKLAEHVFSSSMSSRSDFVITRKKLIHNRIDESKKPSLKPSLKSGIGYVKTESRSKTPPHRRNISSQPRHNTPQPRRNYGEPIHQNFYPMNWNNQQNQGFVCLRTCLEPDEWIKESLNVIFDESPPPTKLSPLVDDDVGEEEAIKRNTKVENNNNEANDSLTISNVEHVDNLAFNLLKPKDVKEALKDESWVVAMQEELNQFVANDLWELVPLPMSQSIIGTK